MHKPFACLVALLTLVASPSLAAPLDSRLVGSWHAMLPCDDENTYFGCESDEWVISASLMIERDGRYRWAFFRDFAPEGEAEGYIRQIGPEAVEVDSFLDPYRWGEVTYAVRGRTLTISGRVFSATEPPLTLRFTRGPLPITTIEGTDAQCVADEVPATFTDGARSIAGDWALSWMQVKDPAEQSTAIDARNRAMLDALRAWRRGGQTVLLHASTTSIEGDVTDQYLRVERDKAFLAQHTSDGFYGRLETCTCDVPALLLKSKGADGVWRFVTAPGRGQSPLQAVFPATECGSAFPK